MHRFLPPIKREHVTDAMELAGMSCLVGAGYAFNIIVGFVVLGVALLVVSYGVAK